MGLTIIDGKRNGRKDKIPFSNFWANQSLADAKGGAAQFYASNTSVIRSAP
jgi:hypothetical protein